MCGRLLIVLLALVGPIAFAPAPFPRPLRDRMAFDLDRFQGTWKVVSLHKTVAGGRHTPIAWTITHIRIRKDHWTYIQDRDGRRLENPTYRIVVDGTRKPAAIDFFFVNGGPTMVGLVRRDGDRVEVLFFSGTARPARMDEPPPNYWLLRLERER